jgi:hypothetical protein
MKLPPFYSPVFHIPFAFYHPLSHLENFISLPGEEGRKERLQKENLNPLGAFI